MQRRFILSGLALALVCSLSHAVVIETAYTRTYAADEIRTLGNHLGSPLSEQGFRTVVASQPTDPGGQYFILHLEEMETGTVATARMTLYTTAGKDSTRHTWTIPGTSLESWLYLGLTGSDWPDSEVRPLAWKIELLDASEAVLSEWKSFLWEMP